MCENNRCEKNRILCAIVMVEIQSVMVEVLSGMVEILSVMVRTQSVILQFKKNNFIIFFINQFTPSLLEAVQYGSL